MAIIALMVIFWIIGGVLQNPRSLVDIGVWVVSFLIIFGFLQVHTWPFYLSIPAVLGASLGVSLFQARVLDKEK